MRAVLIIAALALGACGQAAAPTETPPDTMANAGDLSAPTPNTTELSATPASGQWFFSSDEHVIAAGFGEPQSEFQFSVSCHTPTRVLTLVSAHELAPDQATTLTLLTAHGTIELLAYSFNEGLPNVTAALGDGAK